MKILNSTESFKAHYAAQQETPLECVEALGKGMGVSGTLGGTYLLATGTAAANASLWSLGSGLPLVGGFCAGKATAAGLAAALGVAGGAAFLVPVLAGGAAVAYWAYRNRETEPLQGGSPVSAVARAFAQIAWLPLLAAAASRCAACPWQREGIRDWIQKTLCAWGYSEAYVRDVFDRAMASTPARLRADYARAMSRLRAGETAPFGVKPGELPHAVVGGFAAGFLEKFEAVAA